MDKAKIRFNLGKGKNYMKWKIEHSGGVVYLSPDDVVLKMTNARLRNQKSTATKINLGANKTVCSWILCDYVQVLENYHLRDLTAVSKQIRYNPRVNPFWMDEDGNNIDGNNYDNLFTYCNKIYILAEKNEAKLQK